MDHGLGGLFKEIPKPISQNNISLISILQNSYSPAAGMSARQLFCAIRSFALLALGLAAISSGLGTIGFFVMSL